VKTGLWIVIGLWLVSPVWAADAPRGAPPQFFDAVLGSLPDEIAAAKKSGQMGVMVMFEAEDCAWCEKMKAGVLSQPTIQDYFHKHFRLLVMDINGDAAVTDFSGKSVRQRDFAFKHDRLGATPVFSFFDLNGQVMTRYVGGTQDAEEFRRLGEYVVSGQWKSVKFSDYQRERSAGSR